MGLSHFTLKDIHREVLAAEKRIRPHIRRTYLEYAPHLSAMVDGQVHLKLECLQHTGSFKYRGALNKFLSLSKKVREAPVITASSGNHGTALAALLHKFGGRGTVYLPENASPAKVANIRRYGVEIQLYGNDCIMSETKAKETAGKTGQAYIAPYNDLKIIGGQGTIGGELLDRFEKLDAVLVPVGGGGLISGIAGYLKTVDPAIEIIGCQPKNSAVMHASIQAGKIVAMRSEETLADGTAGGIDPGAITFDICREHVDDFILVSESEIKAAMRSIISQHQLLIEGAAALSVASLMKAKDRFKGKTVVLIISGRRITPQLVAEILL